MAASSVARLLWPRTSSNDIGPLLVKAKVEDPDVRAQLKQEEGMNMDNGGTTETGMALDCGFEEGEEAEADSEPWYANLRSRRRQRLQSNHGLSNIVQA